jgi:arabinofuranan 3-O-arabinosyltransferase
MARTLPLAAVFNLWWIAPALLFYGRHPTVTPTANVSDWSWTHAHASIPNILRLVPIWSWPSPTYFPYAATLERPGLVALAFVPSAVTISSLLVTRGPERRMAVSVVGILAGATLLAKGLHPPLASLNRALYHVPGLWLYREPASKFGMLVAGTLAIGIALFVSSFRSGSGRRNAALAVVAAATIVSFPLWLGRVIPDNRPELAPEHVQIPPYWHELARYLERDPGRTLVLPPDDYYQMPYRWGYYGDDSLPNALIHSSVVILPNPQPPAKGLGYFEADPGAASLAARLRLALSRRGFADAARFARALGIRWVIVRRDIDARFPDRTILDPVALSAQLSRSGAFRPVRHFGALDLFEVPAPRASVWATRSVVWLRPSDPPGAALAVAPGFVTEDVSRQLSSPRLIEPGIEGHGALRTFPTRENERERVTVVERWPRGLASTLVAGPHSVRVVLPTLRAAGRELASFGVGATLPLGPQSSTRLFGLDGSIVETARDGQAPIILTGGAHRLTTYRRAERSVVVGGSFESRTWKLGNCDASGRPAGAVGLGAERVAGGVDGRFALRLSAHRDAACEYTPLQGIDASSVYQISLAYRWKHGAPPRLCIWEQEPRRCAPLEPLAARTRWTRSTQLFRLEPTTRHAWLYLYADAQSEPNAVLYDAVRVERFEPARAATFAVRPAESWALAHTPSQERKPLRVTIESRRALLVPVRVEGAWSHVADCAATDRRPPGHVGIRELATRAAGRYAVTLEARAHAACVHAPVRAFDPAASYRLSLEYRRVRGARPRVCVWERGPGRCAPFPPLGGSSRWHRIAWSIGPDPGTSGLDVYLYADGVPSGTKIRYRGLTVTRLPAAPEVVALDMPAPAAGSPTVSFTSSGGGTEYTVHVQGATEPYVLVLNETFNSGWHLSGTDGAGHIRVNEYANGWIVDRPGSYSLTIRYTPQRIVSIARGVSVAGLSATVLLLGALALRRARRRDRSACSG